MHIDKEKRHSIFFFKIYQIFCEFFMYIKGQAHNVMEWVKIHGGARSLANKHNLKKNAIQINTTHELFCQSKQGVVLHCI